MPTATKKGAADTTPAPVFVAVESFASPYGDFVQGVRVRGDHPAVQAYEHLFAPDGATPEEVAVKRSALYDRAWAVAEATQRAEQAQLARLRAVVATESFNADCARIEGAPNWGSVHVEQGQVFAENDALVQAYPELFVSYRPEA